MTFGFSLAGLAVFIVGVLMAGCSVGWLIGAERADRYHSRRRQMRERAVQAELDALQAANRINLAFWNARAAMSAEARRHTRRTGRPS